MMTALMKTTFVVVLLSVYVFRNLQLSIKSFIWHPALKIMSLVYHEINTLFLNCFLLILKIYAYIIIKQETNFCFRHKLTCNNTAQPKWMNLSFPNCRVLFLNSEGVLKNITLLRCYRLNYFSPST